MNIVITAVMGALIIATFLAGYRIGVLHSQPPAIDSSNEVTPIFDQLVQDYPETYLKLIAPVTVQVTSHA